MSENSKIEWTDHTFNPWEGCQKVGPGCDHCYAEARNARFGGGTAINWGPGAPRRRTSVANWRKPLQWNAQAGAFLAAHGRRQRVFCASLADVFDNAVDPVWRRDLFDLIEKTPNLDWLLLTKRIGNVMSMVSETAQYQFDLDCLEKPRLHDNVWIGATVVNQEEADRDIPKLMQVPARVHFLSMEPLLGPVDLKLLQYEDSTETDEHGRIIANTRRRSIRWVIVGGESGPNARPMHPDWARDLRDQCADAGVRYFFKQWGEWAPGENCGGMPKRTEQVANWFADEWSFDKMTPSEHDGLHIDDEPTVYRVGKKTAGRHLDGRTHDEFPEVR
ncbi:phage Gp37/Gp68 family protein [Paraburkholderia caribensis]|uniref:phage Gp37/Gp68 family protein n=1 Tax=Paraburkholderia caribensis TaxID=75105 RepID=UPI00285A643D|nr:phage Gp37/Gp68 family protein [Paraburkholderia caribensis]MDR6381777.1 protein gp37 [Paraburkholderia caribensis]